MASGQNKNTTTGNELGDIYFILQSIGLDNHFTHIFKKGINWDAFTNVTIEDMQYLGITSPEDQAALMAALNNIKIPYSESVEIERLDVEEILADTVTALRRLRANMIRQIKELENCQSFDPMIDSRTRTSTTLKKIIRIMKHGTGRLEKRLLDIIDCVAEESSGGWKKFFTIWKMLRKRCVSIAAQTVINEMYSLFRDILFEINE